VTARINETKVSKNSRGLQIRVKGIFRINGKAIIGLSGVAQSVSLLIGSNFWGQTGAKGERAGGRGHASGSIAGVLRRGLLCDTIAPIVPIRCE